MYFSKMTMKYKTSKCEDFEVPQWSELVSRNFFLGWCLQKLGAFSSLSTPLLCYQGSHGQQDPVFQLAFVITQVTSNVFLKTFMQFMPLSGSLCTLSFQTFHSPSVCWAQVITVLTFILKSVISFGASQSYHLSSIQRDQLPGKCS